MVQAKSRGFTLIEVILALVVGLIIVSAALSFVVTTYRTVGGNEVREEVYRNARFIGMALERDLQLTGVAVNSTPSFGTLATWNDTMVILRVPYTPNEAPPHSLVPPAGTNNPLNPGGTCGTYCINVAKSLGPTFDLAPGDLARLQVKDERRLILVTSVTNKGTSMAIEFTNADTLLHHAAGLTGGLLLDRFDTFVQKLAPIVYWSESQKLMRAERLNPDGSLMGDVMAYNVQSFKDSLVFMDGHVAAQADPTGADPTSTFDNVAGIRVTGVLAAARPDPRLNQGALFTRSYQWRFAPRNLMWQRNKI